MSTLEDVIITLEEDQNFSSGSRLIGVNLNGRINFSTFKLEEQFGFPRVAINYVTIDPLGKRGVVISLNKSVVLTNSDTEIAVTYSARSIKGEQVTGRILFPEVEFEIGASPITFELDSCCSLPDKIIINVRDHNGGLPVSLTGVESNDADAGTVTLADVTGSDYNDDYNDDFGMEPNKIITYELNKTTDFWKTLNAEDSFQYNISYKGKTASNFITVKLK